MSPDNKSDRWIMIGTLVHKYGSEQEKIAWALCRTDAAEIKESAESEKIYPTLGRAI